MANQKKDSLSTLFSEEVHGPFVTFLFNTHVAHQNVEKDSLVLKNFAKAAKTRFEKKFPEEKWSVFQEKIDALLADAPSGATAQQVFQSSYLQKTPLFND